MLTVNSVVPWAGAPGEKSQKQAEYQAFLFLLPSCRNNVSRASVPPLPAWTVPSKHKPQ